MATIKITEVSFPIEEIKVIYNQFGTEEGVVYIPSDVKLYKIPESKFFCLYKHKKLSVYNYIGITEWSKEKESISHNFDIDLEDESTNFPLINAACLDVYNICDKYLVYFLKQVAPQEGETINASNGFEPKKLEGIYLKKVAEDKEVIKRFIDYSSKTDDVDFSYDKLKEISDNIYRPYKYFHVLKLMTDGDYPLLEVVGVQTNSENYSRYEQFGIYVDQYELKDFFCDNYFSDTLKTIKQIDEEEFKKAYYSVLNKLS